MNDSSHHQVTNQALHGTVVKDMEVIKRSVFEKVRRRLAVETEQETIDKGITTGNTERYDRVLALWVDLQKAIQFCWSNEVRESVTIPWACQDPRVRKAWEALTHPRNEVALEILTYQLPEGTQLETAQKALQECQKRRANV